MDNLNHTYAWTVEGDVTSGTLERYARDWETAHYAGLSVSNHVWTGTGTKSVTTTSDGRVGDYRFYTIRVGDETVSAQIDGRA